MKTKNWMEKCWRLVEVICKRDQWDKAELVVFINKRVPKSYRVGKHFATLIKKMGYVYVKRKKLFVRKDEKNNDTN